MNKKLMLVSLLVLASSVAYARVGETDFGENYKTQFNKGVGGNGQTITNLSDVRYAGVAEFNKVQNEFKDVQSQLDGKADVQFVVDEVNKTYNELNAQKVDRSEFNDLQAHVDAVEADKDAFKGQVQSQLNNKADVDFVTGQVDQAYNELDGKLNNKADYSDLAAVEADKDALREEVKDNKQELNDKIDKNTQDLNNKVDANKQELNNKIDKNNAIVQGQIDGLDNKVEGLDNRVDGIVQSNKVENDKQNNRLDKVESDNKVQNDAIAGVQSQANHNSGLIAQNKNEIGKLNNKVEDHEDRLNNLQQDFAQYDGRLSGLEKKVDNLDDKMNKGMSLMAAMNAVDFQNVQSGEMAIGAGIGHYGNAQSVAVGVAYAPTEDVSLNAKYSITAGDVDSFAVGAGASYKFKVGR